MNIVFGECIVRLAGGGKLLARRMTSALRKEIIEQLWIVTCDPKSALRTFGMAEYVRNTQDIDRFQVFWKR
jgi:hypothetical protein